MKNKNECDVHGAPHKGANRTLLAMMGAALLLMVWHVWVNGPTSEALTLKLEGESFPVILGHEIWDVIAGDFVDEFIKGGKELRKNYDKIKDVIITEDEKRKG